MTLIRALVFLLELAMVLVDENDNIRGSAANPIQVAGSLTFVAE